MSNEADVGNVAMPFLFEATARTGREVKHSSGIYRCANQLLKKILRGKLKTPADLRNSLAVSIQSHRVSVNLRKSVMSNVNTSKVNKRVHGL